MLTASNTYGGGTTVGGGTLQAGNTLALGSTAGSLTVNGPGELDLHGYSLGVGGFPARGPSTTFPDPARPR